MKPNFDIKAICQALKNEKVLVLPTDTIYGLSASALSPTAIAKIDKLKNRSKDKRMVVLIGAESQLGQIGIDGSVITDNHRQLWQEAPTSIILPCKMPNFDFLHRGHDEFAVRLIADKAISNLLQDCGPIVSTSVNASGQPHVASIDQAKELFGGQVDMYVDVGPLEDSPSRLIKTHQDGRVEQIR